MTDHEPGPDETVTCEDALERIYEYLDGELTPGADAAIRAHLATCARCYPRFEHERVFLRFLERHAQLEKAPPSLRRRIFLALLAEGHFGEQ